MGEIKGGKKQLQGLRVLLDVAVKADTSETGQLSSLLTVCWAT